MTVTSSLAAALTDSPEPITDPDALFDAFVSWTGERGLELDPAQTDQIFRDLDALLNKKLNDL